MVTTQPILNEREWTLVMELLEHERQELPIEMRHTDSRDYAQALDERRMIIDDLVQRLHAQGITVA